MGDADEAPGEVCEAGCAATTDEQGYELASGGTCDQPCVRPPNHAGDHACEAHKNQIA